MLHDANAAVQDEMVFRPPQIKHRYSQLSQDGQIVNSERRDDPFGHHRRRDVRRRPPHSSEILPIDEPAEEVAADDPARG